jgi:hypothetical protein
LSHLKCKYADLIKHVLHTTGETSPVSKDDQRQFLPVKVVDNLCSLESRIRKPNLKRTDDNIKVETHRRNFDY